MRDFRFAYNLTLCYCTSEGPVWEARSIPGNLIGVGKTQLNSICSMYKLLEWTEEEEDMQSWYADALTQMNDLDREIFNP